MLDVRRIIPGGEGGGGGGGGGNVSSSLMKGETGAAGFDDSA